MIAMKTEDNYEGGQFKSTEEQETFVCNDLFLFEQKRPQLLLP